MKKLIFSLVLLIGVVFMATPVYASNTIKQIDIGSFDIWCNSAGEWIPSDPPRYTQAYQPGASVHILPYTVHAPSNIKGTIVGVKVSFLTNPEQAFSGASAAISCDMYQKSISPYQASPAGISGVRSGNAVTISPNIVLSGGGFEITRPWQNELVKGQRFYFPVLIEWEIAPMADIAASVSASPQTAKPGKKIKVTYKVTNNGPDIAPRVDVKYSPLGASWKYDTLINFAPGQSKTYTATFANSDGCRQVQVQAFLEPGCGTLDPNVQNNVATTEICWQGGAIYNDPPVIDSGITGGGYKK